MKIPSINNRGFGTLFAVIVLGGVALGLVLWLSTTSLWSVRKSAESRSAAQARVLVASCAENALESIRENTALTGSDVVVINGSSCSYTITNTGGNTRSISVNGSVGSITRKLLITIDSFNPLHITSWQDVQ